MKTENQLSDIEHKASRCAALGKIVDRVINRNQLLRIQSGDDWIVLAKTNEQENAIIVKFLEDLMKVSKDALIEMVNILASDEA